MVEQHECLGGLARLPLGGLHARRDRARHYLQLARPQCVRRDMTRLLGQFDDEVWQAMGTFPWAMMVHGGQEFEWGEPVCAGDEITTEVTCREIYENDGKGFYVFESVSKNQDGAEVVRATWTNIVRGV